MSRLTTLGLMVAAAAATVAAVVMRHGRSHAAGRTVPGGVLMGDAAAYDTLSGLLLGSFFKGIASDVAADVPAGTRVLEVGCGPGHLSIALADRHGLDVTGIDLDPAMIKRAQTNASRAVDLAVRRPTFLAADVASLPFADASFDRIVSTFSMHHWEDPTAGLAELGRVLRPGGRALIWDLRPGSRPRLFGAHHHIPDPADHSQGSGLRVVDSRPWRWPWRFTFAQRTELVRAEDASGGKVGSR
jgi:SAM-dependent methyltransferase